MARLTKQIRTHKLAKPKPPQRVSIARFHSLASLKDRMAYSLPIPSLEGVGVSSGSKEIAKKKSCNPVVDESLAHIFRRVRVDKQDLGLLGLGSAIPLTFPDQGTYFVHVSALPVIVDPEHPFASISVLRSDGTFAWEDQNLLLGHSKTFLGDACGDPTFSLTLKDMMVAPEERGLKIALELATIAD